MNALRAGMLALLAASSAAACSTLLGVDDLPGIARGPDAGDARPDSPGLAAGSLDPSFGDRGVVQIPVSLSASNASVLADGEELVVVFTTGDGDLMLVRCSLDGVCDASPPTTLLKGGATSGVAVREPGGNSLVVYASADAPGYQILRYVLRVARDGGVETLVREPFPQNYSLGDLAVMAEPLRILFAHSRELEDGGELRQRAVLLDGGPDPRFGTNGTAVSTYSWEPRVVGVISRDRGGVVVVANGGYSDSAVWLGFRSDGHADTSFGFDGGIGTSSALSPTALLADDAGYLLGGARGLGGAVLARITREGHLDSSRWEQGTFRFPGPLESNENPYLTDVTALGIQPNGSFLVLGIAHQLSAPHVDVLMRVGPAGLDPRFGANGVVVLGPERSAGPRSLAVQSDGKAVVVTTYDGFLRLARYLVE